MCAQEAQLNDANPGNQSSAQRTAIQEQHLKSLLEILEAGKREVALRAQDDAYRAAAAAEQETEVPSLTYYSAALTWSY